WPESEWVFFIENLETRDWHDLSTSLAFQSTGGQIHFRLHLFSSANDIPIQPNENEALAWFNRDGHLDIRVHASETITSVTVYNLAGQQLFTAKNLQHHEATLASERFTSGTQLLLVEIVTDKKVYVKRVVKR
ncbi:MAG: T9SS sorting signal type C domain-containing protein, partial [Schleiferiaceae bacterium]|nr:T9SS sorting signal type C domain-containing protein [Schleiferiaceae bacterium]